MLKKTICKELFDLKTTEKTGAYAPVGMMDSS